MNPPLPSSFSRRLGLLLLLVSPALILAGGVLRAGPSRPDRAAPDEPPDRRSGVNAPAAVSRSAYAERIQSILRDQETALAGLQEEYRAAPDEAAALEAQKRIRDLRQETEIRLLEAQAERASAAGRADVASRIREDIRFLRDPDRAARLAHPENGRNPRDHR